ncbi:MAG: methyltransferase domain-containing protein [Sphingomicrobium sp.]
MQALDRAATFATYALRGLQPDRKRCPNCGGRGPVLVRKYLVSTLRRCAACQLMYRAPTDSQFESVDFYQEDYDEGATTALPAPADLDALKRDGFPGMECDYSEYIRVLRHLGLAEGSRLFDFGCSWGYGSYQLAQAGFQVKSFEISRPRGHYGRDHLGVDLIDDLDRFVDQNESTFDAFFSAHVLEHVPSPSDAIETAFRLLRPGGLFVSCFPNGCDSYRRVNPGGWLTSWGKVHPNLIDDRFLDEALRGHSGFLATTPVDVSGQRHATNVTGALVRCDPLERCELFVMAIK